MPLSTTRGLPAAASVICGTTAAAAAAVVVTAAVLLRAVNAPPCATCIMPVRSSLVAAAAAESCAGGCHRCTNCTLATAYRKTASDCSKARTETSRHNPNYAPQSAHLVLQCSCQSTWCKLVAAARCLCNNT
eukprot:12833-Heterococcus_DN1.PRE.2